MSQEYSPDKMEFDDMLSSMFIADTMREILQDLIGESWKLWQARHGSNDGSFYVFQQKYYQLFPGMRMVLNRSGDASWPELL
jgi:hypothetical protein